MKTKFTFIDLFAGIGGMRIPFEELGGKCVFSSENDKYARFSYSEMFNEDETAIAGDISKVDTKTIPRHDVLLAGFPCQPFSNAGLKKGFQDTRGTAFDDIRRILEFHKPRAFLLENVPGLRSHDDGRTFETIMEILSQDLNYKFPEDPIILNAKDFGLPQNRKRIFIVGFSKDLKFRFPSPLNLKTKVNDILEKESKVDKKFIISRRLWTSHKLRKKRNKASGKGFGYKLSNRSDEYTRTLSSRYYKDGSEILINRGSRKNPRFLTPKECSRLQGFPKKWEKLPVSNLQAYKQFGNAVSINVVRMIAKEIINSLMD